MKGKRRGKRVWFQYRRESCCNELEESYNYYLIFSVSVKMSLWEGEGRWDGNYQYNESGLHHICFLLQPSVKDGINLYWNCLHKMLAYLFTETSHHNFVFCIFIFHLWQFQFWFHQFSPQFFPLFLLIFHYNFLRLISSAQQIVLFMEKIIIDKNLQFLNDITELWNLNGNGVSWREVRTITFWILPWWLMMMTQECWK